MIPAAAPHPLVRVAHADEHPALRALLTDNALPVADLDSAAIDFLVAVEGDDVLGLVGLERYADVGLLRSLAVRTDRRGTGLGDALVRALEGAARTHGLTQLVLLTQTAAPFFAARGYTVIDRGAAPAAVQRSAEFASLCPASAICMAKPLSP